MRPRVISGALVSLTTRWRYYGNIKIYDASSMWSCQALSTENFLSFDSPPSDIAYTLVWLLTYLLLPLDDYRGVANTL